MPCEPLKLYLSASDSTVAAILVKQTDMEQKPVYSISHMLKGSELRYPKIEKIVFALMASRKLRQYFQGRLISVVTNQPLQRILHKPDMSGRIASWAIELSQFIVEFTPWTSTKSQVLSDFMTECNFESLEEGEISPGGERKPWVLFTDGSSTSAVGERESS